MGFKIRRVDKINNDSVVDQIHEDYHNGECVILVPLSQLEMIGDDIKYLVVDFKDYLVLIYPKET